MTIVGNTVYVDGHRTDSPRSLHEAYEVMRGNGGLAWIDLFQPESWEIQSVAEEFNLHELAVENALQGHQRSKLESFDDTLFIVLRPARYLDDVERVEFDGLHLFIGQDFVVTVRHTEAPNLGLVRQRLEGSPELLVQGAQAVLYAILEAVVGEYDPVVSGLENDIDEIEDELFGAHPDVARRIYELSREVIAFQRATHPLGAMVEMVLRGSESDEVDADLQVRLRNLQHDVIRVVERVDAFRALLQNALSVHGTLVVQRQNEEMQRLSETGLIQNEDVKKISAWAAILFAPTVVGTVYGMNFDVMPELSWPLGYPLALGLMVAMCSALYLLFKRRGWL